MGSSMNVEAFRTRLLHAMPVDQELSTAEVADRLGGGWSQRYVYRALRDLEAGQIIERRGRKKRCVLWRNKQHVMAFDDADLAPGVVK